MSLGDLLEGVAQVVDGGKKLLRAGDEVANATARACDRLTEPETLGRIVGAGLRASAGMAAREVGDAVRGRAAPGPSAGPRRAAPDAGGILCDSHGPQPWETWRHTIVCAACGAIFQTQNPDGAHFAPAKCRCGVQLLPDAGVDGSAEPLCSPCFDDAIDAGKDRMRLRGAKEST